MLQQFLRIIADAQVLNQFEIAEKLNISPAMVLQIARDLTGRGYLEGSSDSCHTPGQACVGCPLGGSCQGLLNTWVLTEKGIKALL